MILLYGPATTAYRVLYWGSRRLLRSLHLDVLSNSVAEHRRLQQLMGTGYFQRPPFLLPPCFESSCADSVLQIVSRYRDRYDTFADSSLNAVGYRFDNSYFSSPDAEVLYAMVRHYRPKTIVEVGSGFSTLISKQAILDEALDTRLIAIDPKPRRDISKLATAVHQIAVESIQDMTLFSSLRANDILFIDSSHQILTASDVPYLYLNVIPRISPGVFIHVHDVFLPYDYPEKSAVHRRERWNEQYMVGAMLMYSDQFEVVWPGHHVQQTMATFAEHFPHLQGRVAASLWLRKRAPGDAGRLSQAGSPWAEG